MSDIKQSLSELIEENRQFKRKIITLYRQSDDKLPKTQRYTNELVIILQAVDNIEKALIRSKIPIRD